MPRRLLMRLPDDFWIGFGVTALAAAGIVLIRTQVGPLASERSILPLIGAAGCLVFGLCLSLQAWRAAPGHPSAGASGEEVPPRLSRAGLARFCAAFAAILTHALLLGQLGLLVTGISIQVVLFLLLGIRNVAIITTVPLASVAVLYAGISFLLGVPLPEGALFRGVLP